jgi:hypothetical protein
MDLEKPKYNRSEQVRKSIDIRNEKTIMKLNALQFALNISTPYIIDRALDLLIIYMNENKKEETIIHSFITQSTKANKEND